MAKKRTRKFKAAVSQVLNLVINSLYSNKEIFLRELISNASDALDKLQFQALTNPELLSDDPELRIRIFADEEAGTITVWDNGIGMTEDELIEQLGTVAHSGTKGFLEAMSNAEGNERIQLIGQFGVGFYSAYLVADEVEVISRSAGSDQAYRWKSDAQESYTVEPAERDGRGTSVVLHLREDQNEFVSRWRLEQLVKQYSDFVGHPIEMRTTDEEAEAEFEQVNQASALWQRSADDITEEQYHELYTHISHDWEPPAAYTHFKIEGMHLFTGVLYIPNRPPFDLFNPEAKHGVRLFVKRVFVMDDADALVPQWLRFVRGVIDSEDLPLNVSREMLQDSRPVRVIRKQLIKKSLEMLDEMASERPEDYAKFWANFGAVLKEGLHFDPSHSDTLAELIRFESSTQSEPTSLADYVSRMPDEQESIYYALGASRGLLDGSPHLETLKKKGFEVLYLTDGIDQWAIKALPEYDGHELIDAIKGNLELDDEDDESEDQAEKLKPLTTRFEEVLGDEVAEVRVSKRLADSPACLVTPEGGMAAHIEQMLRAQGQDVPKQKRVLEINPSHPLISAVAQLNEKEEGDKVAEWVGLIYDQALLAEGSPLRSPGEFAQKLAGLMQEVAQSQLR